MSRINKNYEWPYNLAYDILGDDQRFKDVLPYYLEDAVQFDLKVRECEIVYLRYIRKKSYNEIAKEFGVTMERIRQIQEKAVRKLRYLENRYMGVRRCDYNMVVQENVNLTLQMKPDDKDKAKLTTFLDTPIKDLGLSVRAYNRLMGSHKFATYGDFQNFKIANLFRIHGIGNKVMSEILFKLDAIGFEACSEDHILGLTEWFIHREEYPDAVVVWKGESQQ